MSWYDPIRERASKGSSADRPGSLAGLAQARRIHQGQFFTPDVLAHFMWRIADSVSIASWNDYLVSILDNSVGSGRLLQFARPDRHRLYGLDVDRALIDELGAVAKAAGFEFDFVAAGMEMAMPKRFDLALINPPFSITLQAPSLEPYPCTSYGKFGPNTSTQSHAYALAQAVSAARVVVALLPAAFAAEVAARPGDFLYPDDAKRLRAHIELPKGLFKEEGTDVLVSILVFNTVAVPSVAVIKVMDIEAPLPVALGLSIPREALANAPKLAVTGIEDQGPAIRLPVTGDRKVRVAHDGRRIRLSFGCGLTQARVLNAVLDASVKERAPEGHVHPRGLRYCGEGKLDIEVHLAQPDPVASMEGFLSLIECSGGEIVLDAGFLPFFQRRIKQVQREMEPLRHTVFVRQSANPVEDIVMGESKRDHVVNPKIWGSPLVSAGQRVEFRLASDGKYEGEVKGKAYRLSVDELRERFVVIEGAAEAGWSVVHAGLREKFPQMAQALHAKAVALGLDRWLSWEYQIYDLVEIAMKPKGAIAAWEMGLGKARLAIALVLLSGVRRGLITVEAGLVDEMEVELRQLPIDQDSWKIIRTAEDVHDLRRINVISYERLRLPLHGRQQDDTAEPLEQSGDLASKRRKAKTSKQVLRMRLTYAGALRRRFGITVSDEGDLLANPQSLQCRALQNLSAKRRFVLTGSPVANYPRDILNLMVFAAGDGTAAQPWGWRRGKLEANWISSMSQAERGLDAFRNRFVVMEWSTREFDDSLREGAKREIPRIGDLQGYREMLAPHIKRRITAEPEVAKSIRIPEVKRIVTELQWDDAHLAYYLGVAEEFVQWYTKQRQEKGPHSVNLIALLARIAAVSTASDFPQRGIDGFGKYGRLTSKQRYIVNRTIDLTNEGRKVIVYAEAPGLLELIGQQLIQAGVAVTLFHGQIPVAQRMKALNAEFRFGPKQVLLSSFGTGQKGLNIWQADYEIFASRSWSSLVENQSVARMLRPQQKGNPTAEFVHLRGGIDVYKHQLVSFKNDSARAGIDWAEPETDDDEFLHLDTVLFRFESQLAEMRGVERKDLRSVLAAA